jgi:hypothetical protein
MERYPKLESKLLAKLDELPTLYLLQKEGRKKEKIEKNLARPAELGGGGPAELDSIGGAYEPCFILVSLFLIHR